MWFLRSQARYRAIVQAVAAAGTLAILATPASAFSLAPTSALQSLRTSSCGAATGRGSRIARVHRQRNAPGANVLGLHANGSEEQGSGDMVEKVKAEAQDALSFVGWADERESGEDTGPVIRREDIPEMVARAVAAEEFADERSREMFEQDTFDKLLKEVVRQEIKADYGVELENLLNPIKVVSLNKKIIEAEKTLAGDIDSAERTETEEAIANLRTELDRERRSVMMDWLKTVFRAQAAISLALGAALATDHMPGFPDLPIAARAFGFWTMWLFTIPSLRAVKPLGYPQWDISSAQEKKALNLAFVLTPLTTIALPFATKDPSLIFDANLAAVAACYAYYIAKGPGEDSDPGVEVKGLLKYLDYGTGKERGARK